MPLILGFVEILGAVLLLSSAISGASFADVVAGRTGQIYRQNAGGSAAGTPAAAAGAPGGVPLTGGLANPFAGASHATIGRTDQGVDVSLSPGDPINALADSKVVGILQNWYSGQPFVWFQAISGPLKGQFWYVAEQISPSVSPGQTVAAGQQIGTYSPSGTGLELGLATATGETLARATTGYTEGQATTAGQEFRAILDQAIGLLPTNAGHGAVN